MMRCVLEACILMGTLWDFTSMIRQPTPCVASVQSLNTDTWSHSPELLCRCDIARGQCRGDLPDTAQYQQLLEGWQQVEAMWQLQSVRLWAVIQGPPVGCPTCEGLRKTLHTMHACVSYRQPGFFHFVRLLQTFLGVHESSNINPGRHLVAGVLRHGMPKGQGH